MLSFFSTLHQRNALLTRLGSANLVAALVFLVLSEVQHLTFAGVNAWYKPLKFALSLWIFSWAMGWYTGYLRRPMVVQRYSWLIIVTLGFEVAYIALQAGRGLASHYNSSSPLYFLLFGIMGLAAALATLATGYIGLLFCQDRFPQLSRPYLWAIRWGILLFVLFALEGFVMGQHMAHTVGAKDGVRGLPFLGWSYDFGDLRVAHFVGMHALQVLPLLTHLLLRKVWQVWFIALLYTLLAVGVLGLALVGRGLVSI